MKRIFVKNLEPGDEIEELFLIRDPQIQKAKNGTSYLRAELKDSTGTIPARMWDVPDSMVSMFASGDYVKVAGHVESYRNKPQLIVKRLMKVEETAVDPGDFLPASPADLAELERDLVGFVGRIEDRNLRALLESFFADAAFMELFRRAPAATSYHHAYVGGLLEHSVCVARIAGAMLELAEGLDKDLLIAGCLLHDIGKVEELSADRTFDYTDPGQMIGHLVQGTMMIARRREKIEGFPAALAMELDHLILSHHGSYEFGSPKLPATPEAIALHHIDNIDAKLNAIRHLVEEDPNHESRWTEYSRMFDRRMYKGRAGGE